MVTPFAVFVSGGGRTLANLLERIEAGSLAARVVLVVASRECGGAAIGREAGVPTLVRTAFDDAAEVETVLRAHGAAWVVLGGYLKRLPVPRSYAGRIVNIHPALLPKFGGRGMYGDRVHAAVLAAAEHESGCTVHLVDGEYDSGPIVAQRRCPVEDGDTVEALASRVFELEKELYPIALTELFARERAKDKA